MHPNMTILDNLVAINLSVTIWSARKKLTAEDFSGGVSSDNLPPEELASLGSKRICNPADLRVFGALKSRATTLLDRNGVRFLGGWALPESCITSIQAELETIAVEFVREKEAFLNRYDDAVRDWIQNNPGWESIISNSVVSADYVRSRFGFGWQMFKVQPAAVRDASPESVVNAGLDDAVTSLGETLFGEVAKAATDAWQKSFVGKQEVTRKALSPLKTIHNKLAGLSFVEPRVAPVADLLATAFSAVGKRGHILGPTLVMLQGVVSLLRDPEALLAHAQSMLQGSSAHDVLSILGGVSMSYESGAFPAMEGEEDETADVPNDAGIADDADIADGEELPQALLPVGAHLDSLGLW
ncbi:DUF3150 domain-containing protein [Oleidesulfovibrio sp.]|uniref:DUF3150 domain-containing protein n=1 Tax=Oleidesulfovibrio sp. TaxID=2909707 RepID=UPI003A89C76D